MSEEFGDDVDIVLIDKADGFVFGFSKLDVMFDKAFAANAPAGIILVGALLRQYRHDFERAMNELDRVLQLQPGNTEAISWQFALHLVRADYAGARATCKRLAAEATVLAATACTAVIDGINGQARPAYAALAGALAAHPAQNIEYRQWILTRLAEMAQRLDDKARAERHFREAIATGYPDGFVFAAYADFLLDENRPAEVLSLLRDREQSDILLLRLALAAKAVQSAEAPKHQRTLADRFAASALRGDRLHLQEEARFELYLRQDAAAALRLATDNWSAQREPRDARLLMEAALAAGTPTSAAPALRWMDTTAYEDPRYRALAARLRNGPPQ